MGRIHLPLMEIAFEHTYAGLPEQFFSQERPAGFPDAQLIRVNEDLANELGIPSDQIGLFSGNDLPKNAKPISQVYAGHQFGGFVPRLGDGRAILLGEVIDRSGRRKDIQLKGAGRTEFSRGGDGKSALGPVLREYLMSEAMHALGVRTTRALAAVSTKETVFREEPLPGGVFTRVASSHIRVGTFQYFAAQRDTGAIETLLHYCIERHYPEAKTAENPALAFLQSVIQAQAELVASWLPIGFIHGVMNTDNCSISGETIDYGPCAFMDDFHPNCVFSFIDRQARYSWGNQPTMCHWNMTRLAETLLPLLDSDLEKAKQLAEAALSDFVPQFQEPYLDAFRDKLGISLQEDRENVSSFLKKTLGLLAKEEVDFTLFFRHLTSIARGEDEQALRELFIHPSAADQWLSEWAALNKSSDSAERMRKRNPILIPRNHRIEELIKAAYAGDFAPFHLMVEALQKPYEDREAFKKFEAAPRPEERVANTFCGT